MITKLLLWFCSILTLFSLAIAYPPKALAKDALAKRESQLSDNVVVLFLSEGERQMETKMQRRELASALGDMLHSDPDDLKKRRYSDYDGRAGQWSITTMLSKYYIPKHPIKIEDEIFFKDYSAPEAQDAIKNEIQFLKKSMALD